MKKRKRSLTEKFYFSKKLFCDTSLKVVTLINILEL